MGTAARRSLEDAIRVAVRDGAGDVPARLAARLLSALVSAVRADGGALVLMDPQTGWFSTGAVHRLPAECCHPFFASELNDAPRTFRRLAASDASVSTMSAYDDPDDELRRSVLVPFGYGDEMRAVCRDAGATWGGVSLWRAASAPPFSPTEADLLDAVAPRDRSRAPRRRGAVPGRRGVGTGPGHAGRRRDRGRPRGRGESGGQAALREIDDPALVEFRPLDHLLAVAQRQPRFSFVVGTHDGRWMTAHEQPLSERRTVVVLAASTPAELFGSLVAGVGLSAREVEVTRLLCQGLTDTEIARELGISAHTAHDHVRAVRRKLGVRNRGEVAARIFADHYLDRFLETADVAHVR